MRKVRPGGSCNIFVQADCACLFISYRYAQMCAYVYVCTHANFHSNTMCAGIQYRGCWHVDKCAGIRLYRDRWHMFVYMSTICYYACIDVLTIIHWHMFTMCNAHAIMHAYCWHTIIQRLLAYGATIGGGGYRPPPPPYAAPISSSSAWNLSRT